MKKLNLEEIFVSSLGSKEKLEWYLQYRIDVVNYMDIKHPKFMAVMDITVAFIPKSKRIGIIGDLNSKKILEILQNKRPELHKILIEHQIGRSWLDEQVILFRKRFL